MFFNKIRAFIALCLMGSAGLFGQQTISTNGISFSYEVKNDMLNCTLKAETQGWIGVGFNSRNSIVGSDLLLFNIIGGKPSSTDLYVKGAGNPKKDSELGGTHSIQILEAEEIGNTSMVQFSIPMDSGDPYDFKHKINQEFWLILAYSVADDFGHHSRVRKHIPFKLEYPD